MAQFDVLVLQGCNNPNCKTHGRIQRGFDLELQYTAKQWGIELSTEVQSSAGITLNEITKEALYFLGLTDVLPENVRLVGYDNNGRFKNLDVVERDKEKALEELGVTNGCILFFEPTPNAPQPKKCRLIIIGPDETTESVFNWYTATTTLQMLLDFTIEQFALQDVDRNRIHLITIARELGFCCESDERLSLLDLHDGMRVNVQVTSPCSRTLSEEKKDVLVRCTTGGEQFEFDVSRTATMNDIDREVKKQFQEDIVSDLKIHNEANDELSAQDPNRSIGEFGVKSGQTIFVTFSLTRPKPSSTSTSRPNVKAKIGLVKVICSPPSNNCETFDVCLKKTIDDVIKGAETRTNTQRLVITEMSHKDAKIDFKKERERCLADMGFKDEDIITVILKDKAPTYSSIVSRGVPISPEVRKPSKRVNRKKLPIGLENLGNSCYMNSALQCLAHVPQLTAQFLINIESTQASVGEPTNRNWNPYDEVGDVSGAFAELLWRLWKPGDNEEDENESFKPSRLKEILAKKDRRFAKDDQQDAQEFMTFFLDTIHEELKSQNNNQRTTIINDLFFGELSSTIICTQCKHKQSSSHPISFLSIPLDRREKRFWINFISKKGKDELFHVDMPIPSRVENLVDEFSERFGRPNIFFHILVMLPDGEVDLKTSLDDLPTDEFIFMEQADKLRAVRPQRLKLPKNKPTLDEGLERFFSPEVLPDGWTCQQTHCKETTYAIKEFKLTKLPTVLIIQFKRFTHINGYHEKVETFVDYPIEGLNLQNYVPELKGDALYDLIAVCVHTGLISGGHYVAFARHIKENSKEWYRFDDSSVTRVKPEDYKYDIVSRDAYLLFYIKRNLETYV